MNANGENTVAVWQAPSLLGATPEISSIGMTTMRNSSSVSSGELVWFFSKVSGLFGDNIFHIMNMMLWRRIWGYAHA